MNIIILVNECNTASDLEHHPHIFGGPPPDGEPLIEEIAWMLWTTNDWIAWIANNITVKILIEQFHIDVIICLVNPAMSVDRNKVCMRTIA